MVFVVLRSASGYRLFSWVVNPLAFVFILLATRLLLKFPKYLQEYTALSRQKPCKYSHLWKSQISPWNYDWRFYIEMKPTNAYKHPKVFYIINIISLLSVQVSTTLVAFLRQARYEGYIRETSRTNCGPHMHRTRRRFTMFLILDTLKCLYVFVGFTSISNQLNARPWIV